MLKPECRKMGSGKSWHLKKSLSNIKFSPTLKDIPFFVEGYHLHLDQTAHFFSTKMLKIQRPIFSAKIPMIRFAMRKQIKLPCFNIRIFHVLRSKLPCTVKINRKFAMLRRLIAVRLIRIRRSSGRPFFNPKIGRQIILFSNM